MSDQTKNTIGLFGFGTVGNGFYEILANMPGFPGYIKKVCIKNVIKKRNADAQLFTANPDDIFSDESINIIVELIDDSNAALQIVKRALQSKRAVVSANKKMIAENFEELLFLQKKYNTPLLYEGSCCAGIPIIRCLEEYFRFDEVKSIRGIVNGSTNFILSQMADKGLHFKEALTAAQKLGFAEANPALDIEGHDAANKLSILLAHAFGCTALPGEFLYSGISNISRNDAEYACSKLYKIKLVAIAHKTGDGTIAAFVLPHLIKQDDDLYHVNNEVNALEIENGFAGSQIFKGKGAGAYPTAAAVLSDVASLHRQYRYTYRKLQKVNSILSSNFSIDVCVSADELYKLKINTFESIKKINSDTGVHRVFGRINIRQLLSDNWWRKKAVSLIVLNKPVAETAVQNVYKIKVSELADS